MTTVSTKYQTETEFRSTKDRYVEVVLSNNLCINSQYHCQNNEIRSQTFKVLAFLEQNHDLIVMWDLSSYILQHSAILIESDFEWILDLAKRKS